MFRFKVSLLSLLTKNVCSVEDSFSFVNEIVMRFVSWIQKVSIIIVGIILKMSIVTRNLYLSLIKFK